jgi:hypothetical protein
MTPTAVRPAGDADCNGLINPIDAALVLQQVASLILGVPCLGAADFNRNGTLDSIDAALILQFVAGLIP